MNGPGATKKALDTSEFLQGLAAAPLHVMRNATGLITNMAFRLQQSRPLHLRQAED